MTLLSRWCQSSRAVLSKPQTPHLVMNCFVYRNKSSFVNGLTLRFCALRAELVLQQAKMTLQMLKLCVVYTPTWFTLEMMAPSWLGKRSHLLVPAASRPDENSTLTEDRGMPSDVHSVLTHVETLFHKAPLQILDYCHPINMSIN